MFLFRLPFAAVPNAAVAFLALCAVACGTPAATTGESAAEDTTDTATDDAADAAGTDAAATDATTGDTADSEAADTGVDAAGTDATSSDAADAGSDGAAADTGPDTVDDAAVDVAPDASVDAVVDAAADVADDAQTDAAADDTADVSDADTGDDAPVDAGEDTADAADDAGTSDDVAAGDDADAADDADAGADVAIDTFTGCTSDAECADSDPFTLDACGADGLCTHTAQPNYTLALTSGPAVGANVTVPAGAIGPGVVLTIAEGAPIDNPGAFTAGPAVQFGPGGTQFLQPVTVTLPYDPGALGPDDDLVVLRREDDTLAVTALMPLGAANGFVSVATDTFSTFQPYAVPKPKVLTFTAIEASLPSAGGLVHLNFTASGVKQLTLAVSPSSGVTVPTLAATDTSAIVSLPPNLDPSVAKTYTFTLTATGATGSTPTQATLKLDVAPNTQEQYTKVVSGWGHWLALTKDGHVVCWGGNTQNQCVVPAGLANVTDIACSATASLALQADGTLVQWGDVGIPYTAIPTGEFVSIAGGETHFLAARKDGTVAAWTSYDNKGCATVPAGISGVVAVAAGDAHSLALKSDGTVVGWGNDVLQLVSGPAALTGVKAIAAGRVQSLVLQDNGQASFFGWEGNGAYPAPAPSELTGVKAIAASLNTSCVLKNDGTILAWTANAKYKQFSAPAGDSGLASIAAGNLYCIGLHADGSLGGFASPLSGAPFAALNTQDVIAVSVGPASYGSTSLTTGHTLILHADGTVSGWPTFGQDTCGATIPPDGLTDVVAISAGGQHSLALKSDGTVVGWGCGDAAVVPADVTNATAIAAGGDFSVAYKTDGTVAVWGTGGYNDLWDPLLTSYPPPLGAYCAAPCATAVQPTGVKALSAGSSGAMAMLADGTLSAWGKLFINPSAPPAGLGPVLAFDVGGTTAIALRPDGTIALWGLNVPTPGDIDPSTVTDIIAVAAGGSWKFADGSDGSPGSQWYAVRKDGTIAAGGRNLFETTTLAKRVTGAVAVSAGEWEGVALRFDGTIRAWGALAIGVR